MSNKQTAVEWYANQILLYKNKTNINGTLYILIPINKIQHLKDQAKEMEKHQHGKTWDMAIEAHEQRGRVKSRSICDFDEYWENNFD